MLLMNAPLFQRYARHVLRASLTDSVNSCTRSMHSRALPEWDIVCIQKIILSTDDGPRFLVVFDFAVLSSSSLNNSPARSSAIMASETTSTKVKVSGVTTPRLRCRADILSSDRKYIKAPPMIHYRKMNVSVKTLDWRRRPDQFSDPI